MTKFSLLCLLGWVVWFSHIPLPAAALEASGEPVKALAMFGTPKYGPEFSSFDYVNPDAPKGGGLRLASIGTFDSLNPFILKGMPAEGLGLTTETLMTGSADEPFSQYCWLCETVTIAADRSAITFELRANARFHDGQPVTADDVIFTFDKLRTVGHPFYRSYYRDVERAEKLGPLTVRFVFKNTLNRELPMIMGQLPVLAKHEFLPAPNGRDFTETTLKPLLGSGPYRATTIEVGHKIVYERDPNWWGKDLAINRGRYNFDKIEYEYYRDTTVAIEALFADKYDLRVENIAKSWATAYDAPPVQDGKIIKREFANGNPSGMQGFVFNTRRAQFQDPLVRQALGLAFDFEWANRNIAFNAYTRTNSYFENSELAATDLPSPAELALLEPFREQLPPQLFAEAFHLPVTDGSGEPREQLRRATQLLRQAGWELQDGKLVKNGQPFVFEILGDSPAFERWILPFTRNLSRLGITATYRVVDSAQYQARLDDFDFDVTIAVFPQSHTPGNEQLDFWSSSKANVKGSRNLIGVNNPVVDALLEKLLQAQTPEDLKTATRALDRVLLWNYYVIPHWHVRTHRVAYWDKFGMPEPIAPYALGIVDTWWIDNSNNTTNP